MKTETLKGAEARTRREVKQGAVGKDEERKG